MTSIASSTTDSSFTTGADSSFLSPSGGGWSAMDSDRMLHDESSDASSSYYFLQQFGSFSTFEEEEIAEELRRQQQQRRRGRQRGHSGDWSSQGESETTGSSNGISLMDYDDPDDFVPENSSDDDDDDSSSSSSGSSTNIAKDDLPVGEIESSSSSDNNDDDDESLSRIGIQPLGSYSFDTIMEMEDDDDGIADKPTTTDKQEEKKEEPSSSSLKKSRSSRSIKSQDAYWNATSSNHNNNSSSNIDVTTEEYSFFSEGSEPPQTLWELLRLQTLLGSCTQPELGDSFDSGDLANSGKKSKQNTKTDVTKKEKGSSKPADGWVFFEQMTRCGFPSTDEYNTATTATTKEKTIHGSSSPPNKQELNQHLMGEVYYAQDSDDDDGEEKRVDSMTIAGSAVDVALNKTKTKMKSLLGKLKRQTSANVRSVKLAASFTEDGGSIVNGTEAKYEKFVEEQEQQQQEKMKDQTNEKQEATAAAPPPQPEEGMLCQFTDQFTSSLGGCYDDLTSSEPQHGTSPSRSILATFDDFGVDSNTARNKHTSWAQFDRPFPEAKGNNNNKKALNTSYNSTGTATTAEETQPGSPQDHRGNKMGGSNNNSSVFTDTYGDIHHTGNNIERYDSEYGNRNEARSYLLYQQKHKKSQHRLSKGLKKMKRRFSKTKAEI